MSFQKKKRHRNRALLDEIAKRDCVSCPQKNGDRYNPIDPSHIKTKGSGGPDTDWNVVAHCRRCHIGWGISRIKFFEKYPDFEKHLKDLGWEDNNGSFFNEKLREY